MKVVYTQFSANVVIDEAFETISRRYEDFAIFFEFFEIEKMNCV